MSLSFSTCPVSNKVNNLFLLSFSKKQATHSKFKCAIKTEMVRDDEAKGITKVRKHAKADNSPASFITYVYLYVCVNRSFVATCTLKSCYPASLKLCVLVR